ncbi:MAG: L-threonylcarbamoyladenylate synthase, partial [Gemmatimonadetes bacterium]|nr:L-threonylcarbamoyladenylate synthase [Gemmatimonadota bacterium]
GEVPGAIVLSRWFNRSIGFESMRILAIDPVRPDKAILQEAAGVIRDGGLVAFPTETVYGIGADGTNPAAIRRIYDAKGRDETKPILVLVSRRQDLDRLVRHIPGRVHALMDACWPGPLTLVFPALDSVPRELLGGGSTIGVRHSGAAIAGHLCRAVGGPVTAPSANRSGDPEPITAEDVALRLGGRVDLILDGGRSPSDQPSTVVDVSAGPPRLIRAGCIPFDRVTEAWRQ